MNICKVGSTIQVGSRWQSQNDDVTVRILAVAENGVLYKYENEKQEIIFGSTVVDFRLSFEEIIPFEWKNFDFDNSLTLYFNHKRFLQERRVKSFTVEHSWVIGSFNIPVQVKSNEFYLGTLYFPTKNLCQEFIDIARKNGAL